MLRISLLLSCLTQTVFAALTTPSRDETRSPLTATPARFGFLYGNGASSDKTGSDFSWEQMTLQGGFGLNTKISDEMTLFYGLGYRLTRIDQGASPRREELDDLHNLSLPISAIYHRENSPWTFFAQLSGELASDFKHLGSDDYDFTAKLAAQYEFSDSFTLNFGLSRSRNFGEARVIPGLGFTWIPADEWALTLIGPRITLSHRFNENLVVRAGGFPMGGLWNVEEDSGESVDYGFRSYNAGIGLDYKLRHGVWLTVWAGATFANELQAELRNDRLFKDELDSGFFGYVGINLYEW